MKTSFLEYYKIILEKVSFNPELLIKEYKKAIELLQPSEILSLQNWIKREKLIPISIPVN